VAPTTRKIYFLAKKLVLFAKFERLSEKFSAALHILRKAARIISRKNDSKQAASVEFEMHSIAIIAGLDMDLII